MEGEGENKWKFIRTAILKRFWQNNTEKLLTRIFSYLKIPRFLGCRVLDALVLICGFLLYVSQKFSSYFSLGGMNE